jgi:hypothetical protein
MATTTHAPLTARKPRAAKPAAPVADVVETEAATKPAKGGKKPAAAKAAKPATKPAKKASGKKPQAEKPQAPAAPKGVKCMVANRPGSGVLLFAYTEAVLQLLDMYAGAEIEKATLSKIMGATAIQYHTNKCTLARLDNGRYILTSAGKAFFAERAGRAVAADVAAWIQVLSTGQIDGVVAKNQDMLTAI